MLGLKVGELLILALVAGSLVLPIRFLLTLQRTLELTRSHQTTSPRLVWLMLVPVFDLGWQFYLLRAATRGIKGRFAELGRDAGDGGFWIGVVYQSLLCLATLLSWGEPQGNDALSVVAGVLLAAAAATWVIYWVRISRFNRVMEASASTPAPTAPAA